MLLGGGGVGEEGVDLFEDGGDGQRFEAVGAAGAAAAGVVAGAAGEVLRDDAGVWVLPGGPVFVGGGAEEGNDGRFKCACHVEGN